MCIKIVDTFLQIISIDYMKILILLFIPIKRIMYFINRIYFFFKKGLFWLFKSKEHTNFSFLLNNQQIAHVSFVISKFYNLNLDFVRKEIKRLQNIKMDKNIKAKKYRVVDLDYKPKWDYRLIPYFLVLEEKLSNLYEFGLDQGRLGYLIKKLIDSKKINNNFKYVGVEYNHRKGILIENFSSENFKIIFEKLEDTLFKFSATDLSNSLIISSTHERKSEEFLFNYLDSNKIYPKYLISDETSGNSPYIKFVSKNNYTHTIFPIEDPENFLNTMYIGLAKLQ